MKKRCQHLFPQNNKFIMTFWIVQNPKKNKQKSRNDKFKNLIIFFKNLKIKSFWQQRISGISFCSWDRARGGRLGVTEKKDSAWRILVVGYIGVLFSYTLERYTFEKYALKKYKAIKWATVSFLIHQHLLHVEKAEKYNWWAFSLC